MTKSKTKPIGYHLNEIRKNKCIKLSNLLNYIHVSNSTWYRYVKGESDITTTQFLHTVRFLRTTFSEVAHIQTLTEKKLSLYNTINQMNTTTNYQIPLNEFYLTHNIECLKSAVELYHISSSARDYDFPLDLSDALKSVLISGEYGLEEVNLLILLRLDFNNSLFKESEFINIIHNLLATIKQNIYATKSFGDLSAAQQSNVYYNQSLALRFIFCALASIKSIGKANHYAPLLSQVIHLNREATYPSRFLYCFASQKLIKISEQYLLEAPNYQQEYATFRNALFTFYPDNYKKALENLDYDLFSDNFCETTISYEMKNAYQQYIDKQKIN